MVLGILGTIQCFIYYGGIAVACIFSWVFIRNIRKCFLSDTVSPDGKAVLITGCDHGFGHSLALKLFQDGYTVFAGCLHPNGEGAAKLQKQCSSERMKILRLDVTKCEDVEEAVKQVKKCLSNTGEHLWAVVNNAGVYYYMPFIEFKDIELFRREIEVNQLGIIRITKAFLPFLRKSKGRIVILSSTAGHITLPGLTGYSMTKYATIAFANGLRRELWHWGIKVISIEPEFYKTPLLPSLSQILKEGEAAWNSASSAIRDTYGKEYFQCVMKKLNKMLTHSANPNYEEVSMAMERAVILENPSPFIRVGRLWVRIMLAACVELPPKLQDFIIMISKYNIFPYTPLKWICK